MTHTHPRRTPSDLAALAARVQLWVATFVVWLVRVLGDGPLAAPARRWAHGALACAERGVGAIVVLLALRHLGPPPPAPACRGRRPRRAPHGFAWAAARGGDIRHVTRPLFRRDRDLLRRAPPRRDRRRHRRAGALHGAPHRPSAANEPAHRRGAAGVSRGAVRRRTAAEHRRHVVNDARRDLRQPSAQPLFRGRRRMPHELLALHRLNAPRWSPHFPHP